MDRKISKKSNLKIKKSLVFFSLFGGCLSFFYLYKGNFNGGQVQTIEKKYIVQSKVKKGVFTEKLRLRGSIEPKRAIFLDTISGGRVEEKYADPGELVKKGQPLVKLSNMSLQLDVISREAQVTEQLNFLRNTQMTMETNKLNLRRDLLEIDHEITHLKRKLKQSKALINRKAINRDEIERLEQDLKYYQNRKNITLQRKKTEEKIRHQQVLQLEDSAKMLQKNLTFARKNLDDLLIRAPEDGYVSELDVEIGESKAQGDRLGQIDIPGQYKLVIDVDEYYLSKVKKNMPAHGYIDGNTINLNVSKIDSRVVNSKFLIELDLPSNLQSIKRGQSIEVELIMGESQSNTVLLKRGAFFNSSGGSWIFVIDSSGKKAIKKPIRIGKKNQNYYEVTDGLSPGDLVITSSYNAFDKADTVLFN